MIPIPQAFSTSYAQARVKFLEAAATASARIESHAHPLPGRDGEQLAMDSALDGDPHSPRLLIISSACHGVEGYCGSGVQVFALHDAEWRARARDADVAVLYIHALNPYGFSHGRRVTQENVDLNRNFQDFSRPLPVNEGYRRVHPLLLPEQWPPDAANQAAVQGFVEREGLATWQAAISGGQYEFADGLFYGGRGPSWSRATQTAILTHYLANVAKVGIIDYHTGLGPWGFAEQIIVTSRDSDGFRRAARWYGAALASVADGLSASVRIEGDGLSAAPALLPGAEITGMAIEVGTLPTDQILAALQADCWLHAHGDPAAPAAKPIKDAIRGAFYGDSDDWKGMVAGQSLLAVRQALAGLSEG